jgi:hypothetical protein
MWIVQSVILNPEVSGSPENCIKLLQETHLRERMRWEKEGLKTKMFMI